MASIADIIERVAQALKLSQEEAQLPVSAIIQDEITRELAKVGELPKGVRSQCAWNMLLFLYDADATGAECISKQLTSVSGAPTTTALRYLQLLVAEGLIERRTLSTDQRCSAYSITPTAIEMVETWAARRANALSALLSEWRASEA
ncbi:hypothetical protein [Altererythrobacter sp.]|uniref:hypothetical protein n=1 Tax=Altererythrobacter sp. TaxID=1872480 RepID=UPI003D09B7FD